MVSKKCAICKGTRHAYWPNNPSMANKWRAILDKNCPQVVVKKSHGLCSQHFTPDDFSNWMAYHANVKVKSSSRLKLHQHAVPSVFTVSKLRAKNNDTPVPTEPSTSKRQKLEIDDQDHEMNFDEEEMDEEYNPDKSFIDYGGDDAAENISFHQSFTENDLYDEDKPWKEGKFIIPWSFLLWALSNCRVCGEKENIQVEKRVYGAALKVEITCNKCHASYTKCSSPTRNKMYTINYLLSSVILFSGCLATKVLRVLNLARIHVHSRGTFFRHQQQYLNKAVKAVWTKEQQLLFREIQETGNKIIVAGDARCDSMGHSAKYGSYTLMDVERQKILTTKLIQTKGNSNAMELCGLKECLNELINERQLSIDCFISDRHIQVRKYMRETFGVNRKDPSQPEIDHKIDVWHVAKIVSFEIRQDDMSFFPKVTEYYIDMEFYLSFVFCKALEYYAGLKKDLKQADLSDDKGAVKDWFTAIVNHIYWVPASTPSATQCWSDVVEAKWRSLLNHIVNKHRHAEPLYPKCDHPRAKKRGAKKKKYLKKGSLEHDLITDIVEKPARIKDVRQLSPVYQTSGLEAFHSVLNHFAPKMIHFHHRSMYTRQRLAAIHFNYNSKQKADKKLILTYPKFKKGEPTIRTASKSASFDYVDTLLEEAYKFDKDGLRDNIPEPMSHLHEKPDEENIKLLKANYKTRFTKN